MLVVPVLVEVEGSELRLVSRMSDGAPATAGVWCRIPSPLGAGCLVASGSGDGIAPGSAGGRWADPSSGVVTCCAVVVPVPRVGASGPTRQRFPSRSWMNYTAAIPSFGVIGSATNADDRQLRIPSNGGLPCPAE